MELPQWRVLASVAMGTDGCLYQNGSTSNSKTSD
ncbi:unnamed protein product [Brassica oleracea]